MNKYKQSTRRQKKVKLLGETDEKTNCEENSKKKRKDVCL